MRLKLALFILIPLTFLVACQRQPLSTPLAPVVNPSISGLSAPQVDQLTTDAIRQYMGLFLKTNPFTEYQAGNQLLFYLVSSGELGQAEITLANGETYQADVLYAYTLMINQRVLAVPILVGLVLPDGGYEYFSEKYAFETDGGIFSSSADRQTALVDAQRRLPRGRIFRLLSYGMATRQGLNWAQCSSILLYPSEICQVGKLVEQLYPHQAKTFVLRLADEFPPNWLLVGWVFQEFTPNELVPGVSMNVPLPEPYNP